MRLKGWIILAVLAAGGGAAAYFALREEPPKPEIVTTTKVRRGPIKKKVRGVGHVEPVTQVKVSANISGDLLALNVKDGDAVKRGQLLAEINKDQWLAIVRQNEASLRSQEAAAALEEAQLVQAKAELERVLALQKDKLTTAAEVEQAQANVKIIEARLESAKQRGIQARAALDEASTRLGQTRVTAPIDGTVISLKKKQGEKIRGSDLAEDILLVLAPLEAMQVVVEVNEQDVVGIQVGQVAEVGVDALGKDTVPGRVVEIANSAIIRNQGLENETTSFAVKVALESVPERLRSGMTASVGIVVETKDDVLLAPIEVVTARLPSQLEERVDLPESEKKKKKKSMLERGSEAEQALLIAAKRERPVEIVFLVEQGKAEPRKVKAGISSENDIELVEGVSEGQELISGPYKTLSRTLAPGAPVEIWKPDSPEEKREPPVAERR